MGIIATTISIGVMMASGLGIAAMFKFLHSYEVDVSKKPKRGNGGFEERMERTEDLSRRIRTPR